MSLSYIPNLFLLTGGSVVGSSLEAVINGVIDFVQSPAFAVILALLIVLFIAWILLRIYGSMRAARLGRIIYERRFSEEGVYEGDEVELIEIIRNPGFFPLLGVDVESYFFNELELEEYEADGSSTMQYCISRFHLWPYMQIKRHHRITARKRGHYQLQIATIYAKKAPIPVEAPAELYVYPKAIPLNLPVIAVGRMQGDFVSNRPLFLDPFSLAGIRDYRFGDSISQINFKASARVPMSGSSSSPLKVNARDYCASRRLMIYMNFHPPVDEKIDGEQYYKRAEKGLSFCAALVRDTIYGGFSVGFAANCKAIDGEMSTRFPCESSEAHLMAIMKEMARMNPADGASFSSLLETDIRDGMRDTEIIVVAFDQSEEMLDRIALLEQFGNSVQTVILEQEDDEDGQ